MNRVLGEFRCKKRLTIVAAAICLLLPRCLAQQPPTRITKKINNLQRVAIVGTHSPLARAENDFGRVPSGTKVQGVTIVFSRTAAQRSALDALIAAQQNSSSDLYHKWLKPDEFAARFGVADSDISKVTSWLREQGLSVDGVSRGKNRITFSGTVGQLEAAFGTELHHYRVNGVTQYAPSQDVTVPAALSSVIEAVHNLSTFRPRPHVKFRGPQVIAANPNFTSSQSDNHFITPKDVATIYDINPAYSAGWVGTGQSVAVVGQSSIVLSDIEKFQAAAGLNTKDPTLALVPNSGTEAPSSGDEAESDLDLEYSGAIATGATIYFVYVGNSPNYSVWDAITYAVDTRISPVISASYGICEVELSSSDYDAVNGLLEQAAAQGQTVIAAAGDSGSPDCYGTKGLTTSQQEALAVDFPASSQYVTGMGGTEFPSADVASSNTQYWSSANGGDVISSVLSYIPEQVWNDDSSSNGLSSGGGGTSTLTPRPSWQTGVAGIPSGTFRLVPDISLDSSPINAGYLFCSSDSTTGATGSCANGFRDSNDKYLTVGGGTSFAAPIFAGMVAIINQKLNSTGQGVVNPTLYSLAANSTIYGSAFHDITKGSNQCTAGAAYCSATGPSEYSATTGYDEASGLGSIDFYNLLTAWPTGSTSLQPSTTTISAATLTPAAGANDVITISVASGSSSVTTTPSGHVTLVLDSLTVSSSLVLTNGSATYSFSSTTAGSHVITATYSGDSTFAASTGSLVLTVDAPAARFALSATNTTIAAGNSGTSTVTITPQNGYTGTIKWNVVSSTHLSYLCFSLPNTTVSGSSAVKATLTIYTKSSDCTNAALGSATHDNFILGSVLYDSSGNGHVLDVMTSIRASLAITILLFGVLLGCGPRSVSARTRIALVALLLLAMSACGGSSGSSPNNSTAAKGTYTVIIVGTDTTSFVTASTTMTVVID